MPVDDEFTTISVNVTRDAIDRNKSHRVIRLVKVPMAARPTCWPASVNEIGKRGRRHRSCPGWRSTRISLASTQNWRKG